MSKIFTIAALGMLSFAASAEVTIVEDIGAQGPSKTYDNSTAELSHDLNKALFAFQTAM